MRPHSALALVLMIGVLTPAPALHAQKTTPTLGEVQAAYAEVDFERTRTLSRELLDLGTSEPADSLALYRLLGISAAALGDDDAARSAFRVAIALDPDGRLDKDLSPKIRGPYLEARGALGSAELRPLSARLRRDGKRLLVEASDSAGIAHTLLLEYRGASGEAFRSVKLAAARQTVVPSLPRGELEYALTLRDEHGNVLFRRGSAAAPETLAASADTAGRRASQQPSDPFSAPVARERVSPTPYYVLAGALAAGGLAAGGVGAMFHVRREELAEEWNGASCERGGESRGAQCADVDDRRQRAETLSIGLYAGGGALLVGSLVTLLLTPSRARDRHGALACDFAPAPLGAGCRTRF